MKITGAHIFETGEVIYSRARHDFRWDDTRTVAVDGGFDYFKLCYTHRDSFEVVEFDLDVDKNTLLSDYNAGTDCYGSTTIEKIK